MTAETDVRFFRSRDGLSLAYRRFGPPEDLRPAILCLPGLARNSRDFLAPAARLAAQGRIVLCPDWRGRGHSDRDPRPERYSPQSYVDDLSQLLALEGVERFLAIGTSMGGLIACALGVVKPAGLAGVLLNDIGPELPQGGLARIRSYIGRDWPQPDWPSAVACLKAMLPTLGLQSEAEWQSLAEASFRSGPDGLLHVDWDPRIADALAGADALPDLWALFRSLRDIPVTVVRGGQSDILSADLAARMEREHPGLRSVVIPWAGHTPTLSEPACQEAINELCAASR